MRSNESVTKRERRSCPSVKALFPNIKAVVPIIEKACLCLIFIRVEKTSVHLFRPGSISEKLI